MIRVRSEAEIVDAVRQARETRRPFEIVAGGTRRGLGRPVEATVLDVSGLSGIVKYEPEELILTARPGTPLVEIAQVLAEKQQRLGFDPPDWSGFYGASGVATLGGAIASDACGSASLRYGRTRDQLLGYRAVNGLGEAYKAGGYVVKNVTGFDLSKLMCGALGTLGVLTEVTLRVFPKPARSAIHAVELGAEQGLALLRKVWNSTLESTGLAYAEDRALIRLEGSDISLREKRSILGAIAPTIRFEEFENGEQLFKDIGAGTAFSDTLDDIWLAHLPPANAYAAVADHDRPWLADCAGARLWLATPTGDDGRALRARLAPLGGRAVLMRGDAETRKRLDAFPPEVPALAALTRSVKAAFDPLGLFNPGRMYKRL